MLSSRHQLGLAVRSGFVAVVIVGMVNWVVATSLLAHSGGEVVSKQTASPIEVDGVLDEPEWVAALAESSPLQDITTEPQEWYQVIDGGGQGKNTNQGGLRVSRGQIDGDDDLLVRWATLWDEEYLYFGFDVIDDNPNMLEGDCEGRQSRDFDGFWLCFDTLHDALDLEFPEQEYNTAEVASQSSYEVDDVFWEFVSLTERVDGCVFGPGPGSQNNADFLLNDPLENIVQGEITDTGYTAEIRIPWAAFEPIVGFPVEPEDELVLGFDITVMDVDGDPPGSYDPPLGGAMAWSSDFENDNSPGVLGHLIISEEMIALDMEPTFKRGDADGVGAINITDGVFLLSFLFGGGEMPPCMDAADASDAGQITITSAVYIFNFLFAGGADPLPPGIEACGPDPTEDDVDCAAYENC